MINVVLLVLDLKDLQQNGTEWNILSQGSRELEGLLKLVSKERLQLERHFVLATQVSRFSPNRHRFESFVSVIRHGSHQDLRMDLLTRL